MRRASSSAMSLPLRLLANRIFAGRRGRWRDDPSPCAGHGWELEDGRRDHARDLLKLAVRQAKDEQRGDSPTATTCAEVAWSFSSPSSTEAYQSCHR
jgi:hypothetical protein